MATRSAIGYLQPSGNVRAAYCHWDGYPEHQLPILEKHYSGIRKVQRLIKPGSMSSLRTRQLWEHSNLLAENGEIVRDAEGYARYENDREPQPLYHHERGEVKGIQAITSANALHTWFVQHDCEFLYVFDGKKWITYSRDFCEG